MEQENEIMSFSGYLKSDYFKKATMYSYISRWKSIFIFLAIVLTVAFLILHLVLDLSLILTIFTIVLGVTLGMLVGFTLLNKKIENEFNHNPLANKEINYVVTSSGITIIGEQVTQFYKWKDFIKVREIQDMFIFNVTPLTAIIIPKSFFETDDDLYLLKELLNKNTK